MKELGSHGPGYHAALSAPLREAHVDYVILVGEEMTALAEELGKSAASELGTTPPFAHCTNVGEAVDALRAFGLERDDAILVKGSNSVGLASLVTALSKQEG
jgi:UDP-N-acetylmuramoyl-tripeptide--D-alanyl-D-alanine ligase